MDTTNQPEKDIERSKNKKYSLKRSITYTNWRTKTNKELFDESFHNDIIQTNLERMINNLGIIKKKLILISDPLASQIDWMIDTLLKNQLNDVILKLEKETEPSTNAGEIEKMLELLAEFSSELNIQRNIDKLQSTFIQKKQNLKIDYELGELYQLQDKILIKNFDIFEFSQEVGRDNLLKVIAGSLFNYFSLLDRVHNEKFFNFIEEIRIGYKKSNFYHNDIHAADVTQTISLILDVSNMMEDIELYHHDVLSFLLSAIVHDYKHTGQTNAYHINKQTDLALKYNDISVLENYHISETFKVISNPDCDILVNYSKPEAKLIRKRIIGMILATDMTHHTKLYTSLKLKIEKLAIDKGDIGQLVKTVHTASAKFDAKQELLNYALHAADLSHNVKSFEVTRKWTNLVMNEFWEQGDLERKEGLPISFNCDRTTANVPKGQMGFLNGIIIPTFQLLAFIFPKVEFFVDNAKNNLEKWNEIDKNGEKI
jgi:hypothetical protein